MKIWTSCMTPIPSHRPRAPPSSDNKMIGVGFTMCVDVTMAVGDINRLMELLLVSLADSWTSLKFSVAIVT